MIIHICREPDTGRGFTSLGSIIRDINRERNMVVHGGQFKKSTTALKVIKEAKEVIEILVGEYKNEFQLKEISILKKGIQ